ncbi:MAG TPA: aspartyl/asparaginyl beta-hydroxylase domain-containing protein [Vicinamibacterales bacterium]
MTDNVLPRNRAARETTMPAQRWQTEGIAPMERPGAVSRMFMRIVAFAERQNLRWSKLGNPCVYDTASFRWAADIERDWQAVRDELVSVLARKADLPNVQDITADAATISRDAGWKIFPFTAYGVRSQLNIERCPATWRIVQRVPGLRTAMFSILDAGKRIPPHRGPYNGVLRLHLGLVVPEPPEKLGIRVGSDRCQWREGKVLIFDDAFEHEAWNDTEHMRAVLFVDFERPMRFPARTLNRALLAIAPLSPFLREGRDNLRRWERRFYGR